MGPQSAAEDDLESSIWANGISRSIPKWHEDQLVPAVLSVLQSRLPPIPITRKTPLRSLRTPDEEAALQARIREHMRHKVQITREIFAQDTVERTFLSWRDHAVKNQLEISSLGSTAVLARFQEEREKKYLAWQAAEWISTEQLVHLGLDMLSLENQRISTANTVETHETYNILTTLHSRHTNFQQTIETAESSSREIYNTILSLQTAFSKTQQSIESSTHPLQHSVISSLSKTLHRFQNVLLPMSDAAGEWSHLTALLSFLRDTERRQRLQRLQAGVRAIRRKTKARMMIAALDTLVSTHSDLEDKLLEYQQQQHADAIKAVVDFLNVQWRVHRIVCDTVEQERCLPLVLNGLTSGLEDNDEMDERADAQRQARQKVEVNRMLHGWWLREQQVRAKEEVEKFQKEVMGE